MEAEKEQEREETQKDQDLAEEEKRSERPSEALSKEELEKKVKELEEKANSYYDKYLRAYAELENFKKRSRREKEEWKRFANEVLIKELLSVLDNLEMALSHSENENAYKALKEGLELTLKGFKDILLRAGLKPIKTEGERFDPHFHEALGEREDENVEAGMIIEELQKGYMFNDRLLRPAKVIVSKGKPDQNSENNQ